MNLQCRLILGLGDSELYVLQIAIDLVLQGQNVACIAILRAHKGQDERKLVHLDHLIVGVHGDDGLVPAQTQFARLVAGGGECGYERGHQGEVHVLLLADPQEGHSVAIRNLNHVQAADPLRKKR